MGEGNLVNDGEEEEQEQIAVEQTDQFVVEETGAAKDGIGSSNRRSLPLQLHRLPASRLRPVQDALAVLQEAGLTDIANVADLRDKVSRNVSDTGEHLTTYAAMCEWSWTRTLWRAAVPSPQKEPELATLSEDEAASRREALAEEQRAAKGQQGNEAESKALRKARYKGPLNPARARWTKMYSSNRTRGCSSDEVEECFNRWLEAQSVAAAELRLLDEGSSEPRSLGEGSVVLFQKAAATNFVPASQVKPTRRRLAAAIPEPSTNTASIATTCSSPAAITMHVGGAGCCMGAALWAHLFAEHGLGPDGRRRPDAFGTTATHFDESRSGRFVPRAVLLDADAGGLSAARVTKYFAPDDCIEGSQCAAGNWAEAYHGSGKVIADEALERLRMQTEKADSVNCIFLTHAMHGGAGGGLSARILENLSVNYCRKIKWSFTLTPPSQLAEDNNAVASSIYFNAMLSTPVLLEHCDVSTLIDNTALNRLATARSGGLALEEPTVSDYNGIVARVLAAYTSPLRVGTCVPAMEGTRRLDARSIMTNFVPYPRIHFMVPSIAPLRSEAMDDYTSGDDTGDAVRRCLTSGLMSSVDLAQGKHMAVGLFCRGVEQHQGIAKAVTWKASRLSCFCDWSPTGIIVGSHRDPTVRDGYEVAGLFNTTATQQLFKAWSDGYEQQDSSGLDRYCKAGMEKEDIVNCFEDVSALIRDYDQVGMDTLEDEDEED